MLTQALNDAAPAPASSRPQLNYDALFLSDGYRQEGEDRDEACRLIDKFSAQYPAPVKIVVNPLLRPC